jgi:hypothetical protein
MSAIKRLTDRPTQRCAFRIIDDHRCPGDGLERQPLQPDCAAKRKNCDRTPNPTKHVTRIGSGKPDVNSQDALMTSPMEIRPARDDRVQRRFEQLGYGATMVRCFEARAVRH